MLRQGRLTIQQTGGADLDSGAANPSMSSAESEGAGHGPVFASRSGMQPVLVVEDDGETRELLARYLEHRGIPVVTASNGKEGLERLARKNPAWSFST